MTRDAKTARLERARAPRERDRTTTDRAGTDRKCEASPRVRGQESTRQLGDRGERLAEAFLVQRGYVTIARNVHTRSGEIDLIALEGGVLCFIEVRLRRSDRFGTSADSVDARKRTRVVRAARAWLARCEAPPHDALRFDVVTVDAGSHGPQIELYANAFGSDARTW